MKKLPFFFIFISMPWDQTTPIGFFFEWLFDLIGGEMYWLGCATLLLLFVSFSMHHHAFCVMFRHLSTKMNVSDNTRNEKFILLDLIHFHITVKK